MLNAWSSVISQDIIELFSNFVILSEMHVITLFSYRKQRFIHKPYKYQLINRAIKRGGELFIFQTSSLFRPNQMNCNTQTFLLRWIHWFCDLNWIIVISFHRPNSPHSPGPNWLISTAWVEFDRGVEEQTLVQSDQCGGLSCSRLNERPCPSGWNRSDLLDGPFYSPLICGISDEVFW